jgi:hypothetical protein
MKYAVIHAEEQDISEDIVQTNTQIIITEVHIQKTTMERKTDGVMQLQCNQARPTIR